LLMLAFLSFPVVLWNLLFLQLIHQHFFPSPLGFLRQVPSVIWRLVILFFPKDVTHYPPSSELWAYWSMSRSIMRKLEGQLVTLEFRFFQKKNGHVRITHLGMLNFIWLICFMFIP
jgi:hypothetical protein